MALNSVVWDLFKFTCATLVLFIFISMHYAIVSIYLKAFIYFTLDGVVFFQYFAIKTNTFIDIFIHHFLVQLCEFFWDTHILRSWILRMEGKYIVILPKCAKLLSKLNVSINSPFDNMEFQLLTTSQHMVVSLLSCPVHFSTHFLLLCISVLLFLY